MTTDQLAKINWLKRAYDAEQVARAWTAKLEHDRSIAERTNRNGLQNLGNPSGNATESLLIQLADTEHKTKIRLKEMMQIQTEITEAIAKIPNLELQTILIRHYLAHETFEQIAEQMHCSTITVKRKHKKSLAILKIDTK